MLGSRDVRVTGEISGENESRGEELQKVVGPEIAPGRPGISMYVAKQNGQFPTPIILSLGKAAEA